MFAALFAAIICVATIVVQIPTPATNGFFNLGDCFVIIAREIRFVNYFLKLFSIFFLKLF